MSHLALVGNPNVGKSVIFNVLTNMNQKIGNFPGVTVDVKVGVCEFDSLIEVIDLPGVYSLRNKSNEEDITVKHLKEHRPDMLINVADSTTLSRDIELMKSLVNLQIPMMIVLTKYDCFEAQGNFINHKEWERRIGVPVILFDKNNTVSKEQVKMYIKDEKLKVGKIEVDWENLLDETVNYTNRSYELSDHIDRFLLHPIIGYIALLAFIIGLMMISFNTLGSFLQQLVSTTFDYLSYVLTSLLVRYDCDDAILLFLNEGIIKGIGGVFSFIPTLFLFYIGLCCMEDCGYMSRMVLLMDYPLSYLGLNGKSVVALIGGYSCAVPAIASSRIIEDTNQRKRLILVIPYMICSAKLPVIICIIGMMGFRPSMLVFCYLVTIVVVIIVLSMTSNRNCNTLVCEMPPYMFPDVRNVLLGAILKVKEFIQKTFVYMILSYTVLYFLLNYTWSFEFTDSIENSIMYTVAVHILPLFEPIGIFDYRLIIAIVAGVLAKENILAVILLLFGNNTNTIPVASICSFLVFILLYIPCIPSILIMVKEEGVKSTLENIIIELGTAYICSGLIYYLVQIMT